MQVISLSNHIVRKALQLSLNEMAVLCDIVQMSQNPKYGNWCVKSKDKIADWLDLSRDTVYRAIGTLVDKGYIEKDGTFLRPTAFTYALITAQDEIGLFVKSGDLELISAKIKEIEVPYTPSQNQNRNVAESDLDRRRIGFEASQKATQDIHRDIQDRNTEKEVNNPTSSEFESFIKYLNEKTGKKHRGDRKAERQFRARLKDGYSFDDIKKSLDEMCKADYHIGNSFKYVTPEFATRQDKIEMYLNATAGQKKNGYEHLQGYNPRIHGHPDYRFSISDSGLCITYNKNW